MENELFIAIMAGLGGMLGWGLADLFAKKTIDQIGDVVSLAWGHLFGVISLALIFSYQIFFGSKNIVLNQDFNTWALLAVFGVFQAIVYLLVYNGFGKGQVSVLNPVFASFSGLTALFSIVIFGEIITGNIIWALVTIFIGLMLLNLDIEALKSKRFNFVKVPGFKEIGLATILAAFWTLFWDKFVGGQDWIAYTFFMYTIMTVVIFGFAYWKKIKLKFSEPSAWKFLVLIGFFEIIAYLSISYGYSATSFTSVVALLSGAFSLPTIILARAFLKEKTTRIQTVGSLVIILGIIIISLL